MASTLLIFRRNVMTIKPHVPLIKFRKGGVDVGSHHSSAKSVAPDVSKGSQKVKGVSGPVIEDFQLPLKYRRLPIDEKEINAINSGGVI